MRLPKRPKIPAIPKSDSWEELEHWYRGLVRLLQLHEADYWEVFGRTNYLDPGWRSQVRKHESLAKAASISSDTFAAEIKRSYGAITDFDIASAVREQSRKFRTRKALLRHASRWTRTTLCYGPKLLRDSVTPDDYDYFIEDYYSGGQELVFEHAAYALYVAWRPDSRIIIPDNRRTLLKAMTVDESLFRAISPRQFEELVAYLYECLGCRVQLTPATRDWGADILAWHGGPLDSEILTAIQVKRYASHRKVGLKSLFDLYGAIAHYHADTGHIVTSSDFTKPARIFAESQRLHLVNLKKFQEELNRLFL